MRPNKAKRFQLKRTWSVPYQLSHTFESFSAKFKTKMFFDRVSQRRKAKQNRCLQFQSSLKLGRAFLDFQVASFPHKGTQNLESEESFFSSDKTWLNLYFVALSDESKFAYFNLFQKKKGAFFPERPQWSIISKIVQKFK